MIKFTFFKTPKPRQFNYTPLYYDPEKEAREKRRKELLGDDPEDLPEGEYKPGMYIRRQYARTPISRQEVRRKPYPFIRIAILLILLGIALWWIFK